jgi:hypothetical protein
MSRDPEDHGPTDTRELHKYLYAGGDPVTSIDPTGRGLGEDTLAYYRVAVEVAKFAASEIGLRLICTGAVIVMLDGLSPDVQWRIGGIALALCGLL